MTLPENQSKRRKRWVLCYLGGVFLIALFFISALPFAAMLVIGAGLLSIPFLPEVFVPHWIAKGHRRVIWLLMCSVGAGLLCSLIGSTEARIRAVILSFALSLGLVAINRVNRDQLVSEQKPKILPAMGIGILAGLIPGLLFALFPLHFHLGMFDMESSRGLSVVLMCVYYGVALHGAYALRWKFTKYKEPVILGLLMASGYLCALIRGMVPLLTGVPFALTWGIVAIACDPAWSFERWKNTASFSPVARSVEKDKEQSV